MSKRAIVGLIFVLACLAALAAVPASAAEAPGHGPVPAVAAAPASAPAGCGPDLVFLAPAKPTAETCSAALPESRLRPS